VANQQQPGDDTQLSPKGAARRRFTRAGAATGVMLTLHSHSAMATGTAAVCTTASGFMSGALRSTHSTQAVTCSGVSPGYWKNCSASVWPRPTNKNNDYFTKYFPSTLTGYSTVKAATILDPQQFDNNNAGLGRHLMAAYLNTLKGWTSFQSTTALQKIWTEWRDHGYYTPIAGVKWYAADIVNYLKQTMT